MGDFYHTEQGEGETVTSFATHIERLLSYVRDKFPCQIPMAKEQQLLKDRLFHGCQKGIRDSVKYRHADTTVDYMSFLEECRKAEDEDGWVKIRLRGKLKLLLLLLAPLHTVMLLLNSLKSNNNNLMP